jgi:hypothetical protein
VQTKFGNTVAERCVDTVSGVCQHGCRRHAGLQRYADLVECDLRLGLECDLVWNTSVRPPCSIVRPGLWQIEAVRDWQAGMIGRKRQRDGDLAIVLFAELATILPGDTDRVDAFLGMPVSSTIQPRTVPRCCMMGKTRARTASSTVSSDQSALATKWCNDWWAACIRPVPPLPP